MKLAFLRQLSNLFCKSHHPVHEANEGPESNCVILHHSVERCQEIAHTLYIAQIWVVLVVCEEHVLHLLQMHVGTRVREWGVGVWMRDIFSSEKRNRAVGAMNILFYLNLLEDDSDKAILDGVPNLFYCVAPSNVHILRPSSYLRRGAPTSLPSA